MKKCISLVLALLMALALCTVSWAADPVYPAGVTKDSFPNSAAYVNDQNVEKNDKPAVVAYMKDDGTVEYAADLNTAIVKGATEVWCKEGAEIQCSLTRGASRTVELTNDLTVHANGANFQYTEIALNNTSLSTASVGKDKNLTLKVYDAMNIKVWGNAPSKGVTQTIVMENCTNIGTSRVGSDGILLYISNGVQVENGTYNWDADAMGTINATVKDCRIEKNSSGIYMSTNGSLNVTNTTFEECASGIKTSYKGTGTRTDTITGCTFTGCGCDAADAGNTGWLADDSSAIKAKNGGTGTMTVTIDNNTIETPKGDKGDIQVISDKNTADVTVKNTAAKVTVSYKKNNESVVEEKTLTKDNTLTIEEGGSASVTQPEQKPSNNHYYYYPTTTTDTTTKGSPKTFDAGIGVYAVTAVLSLSGMAWTAKKRH